MPAATHDSQVRSPLRINYSQRPLPQTNTTRLLLSRAHPRSLPLRLSCSDQLLKTTLFTISARGKSMEDYRSKPYAGERARIDSYYETSRATPSNFHDMRSYSLPYAPTYLGNNKDLKLKKGKSTSGSSSKSWTFSDPEFQRKKRVASYKAYSVEGKVKGSLRKSFKWLQARYNRIVYGW